jgi:glycosyltransferase involved in cell wall biosynthesis
MGRVRAAVYNRYWPTGGGGEAYGAGVAHVLAQRAEVDLLCHEPVDLAWLSERLRIDLSGVRVVPVLDRPGAVTAAVRDHDLFVNVSFMSGDLAPTRRSLYVVHFPTPPELGLSKPKKAVVRGLRAVAGEPPQVELAAGFFGRDPGARGVRWTDGEATLAVTVPEGTSSVAVSVVFGPGRPDPTPVSLLVDGQPAAELEVGGSLGRLADRRGTRATVVLRGEGRHEVAVRSDTFVPAERGGDDTRQLGVPIRAVLVGHGVRSRTEAWLPWLGATSATPPWQASYGALVANSQFTSSWIKRWWAADSEVLYPPVTMQAAGLKRPTILNVGRFFAAEQGHSKKQLEMVQAFRQLVDGGLQGWTLDLVGGCEASGRPYLHQVQQAAAGYPVRFHVDASGEELAALYAEASIYWHASGMGEDPKRHPGRLEHFGMTTVEAMSAGAVPVVIGLAGQTETVRHGIDGFHFHDRASLVELTRLVVRDEGLRAVMSASAQARARHYSLDAFGERFWTIVDGLPSADGDGHYGAEAP